MRKLYKEIGLIVIYGSVLAHSNHILYLLPELVFRSYIFRGSDSLFFDYECIHCDLIINFDFFSLKCIAQWNNSNFIHESYINYWWIFRLLFITFGKQNWHCGMNRTLSQIHWNENFCSAYGLGVMLNMTTPKLWPIQEK